MTEQPNFGGVFVILRSGQSFPLYLGATWDATVNSYLQTGALIVPFQVIERDSIERIMFIPAEAMGQQPVRNDAEIVHLHVVPKEPQP